MGHLSRLRLRLRLRVRLRVRVFDMVPSAPPPMRSFQPSRPPQADAVALLERLGAQYEQDHEKDLKDMLTYLPEEAHGIGWQAPGAAGYVYGTVAAGEETVNGAVPAGLWGS